MVGALVLLTPVGALAALAAVIPLVGLAAAMRRERAARELLRLPAPPPVRRFPRIVALVAIPLLLAVAAMQPAVRTTQSLRVRQDAQAFFVVDITRSMGASRSPSSPTRLQRAREAAIAIRSAIPEIPSGVASMTDRVLPQVFPTPNEGVFDRTVGESLTIEQPPPLSTNVLATSLDSIGALGTQNYFPSSIRKRLIVVLTDGESVPFDVGTVTRELGTGPGVHTLFVRVGSTGERVFDHGKAEQGYHPHPESQAQLTALVNALGTHVYDDGQIAAAAGAARAMLGSGPTVAEGITQRTRTLAPWVALLALVPLAFVLPRPRRGLGADVRVLARDGSRRLGARVSTARASAPRDLDAPTG